MGADAGLTRLDRPWHRPGAARYARVRLPGLLRPPVEVYEPEPGSLEVLRDQPVTVRDGTVLRVNVMRPPGDGTFPVLLSACPPGEAAAGACRCNTGCCGSPAGCGSRR